MLVGSLEPSKNIDALVAQQDQSIGFLKVYSARLDRTPALFTSLFATRIESLLQVGISQGIFLRYDGGTMSFLEWWIFYILALLWYDEGR